MTETLTIAAEARAEDILIIVIGVTSNVDDDELKGIASSNDDVFKATNFADIDALLDQMLNRACQPG